MVKNNFQELVIDGDNIDWQLLLLAVGSLCLTLISACEFSHTVRVYWISNFTVQSHFWEAASFWSSHEDTHSLDVTVPTEARYLSVSWARSIPSSPSHALPVKTIIILTFPSTSVSCQWSLSLRLSYQTLYASLLLPLRATFPTHLILIHLMTRTMLVSSKNYGPNYVIFSILSPRPTCLPQHFLLVFCLILIRATEFHTHTVKQCTFMYNLDSSQRTSTQAQTH